MDRITRLRCGATSPEANAPNEGGTEALLRDVYTSDARIWHDFINIANLAVLYE